MQESKKSLSLNRKKSGGVPRVLIVPQISRDPGERSCMIFFDSHKTKEFPSLDGVSDENNPRTAVGDSLRLPESQKLFSGFEV